MRLPQIVKMGYVPLPPQTQELLCGRFEGDRNNMQVYLLDPCAGEGVALQAFGDTLKRLGHRVTTYGVELAPKRAAKAALVLDHVHCASWEDVAMTVGSVNIAYINGPYDNAPGQEGIKKPRQEYLFLKATINTLQTGGLLLYIIPQHLLKRKHIATYIAVNFRNVRVYRFPNAEYEAYSQVVLIGYRKVRPTAADNTATRLHAYGKGEMKPPLLDEFIPPITIPLLTKRNDDVSFVRDQMTYDDLAQLIATQSGHHVPEWQRLRTYQPRAEFTPVIPLRKGHVGSLIASGQIGTVLIANDEGQPLLTKGYTVKVTDAYDDNGVLIEDAHKLSNYAYAQQVKEERQRFASAVYALAPNGTHHDYSGENAMRTFIQKHTAKIAEIVQHRYPALYTQPTAREWHALAPIFKDKRLPGRDEGGMLPAQRHVAIAATRAIQHQGWADIIAEPGFGKTVTSAAIAHMLDTWPLLVVCPGHLVNNWANELIEAVSATPIIIEDLADLVHFHRKYAQRPTQRIAIIVSLHRINLGPGWQHVTIQKEGWYSVDEEMVRATGHFCPTCGGQLLDKHGVPMRNELPLKKRLFCKNVVKQWIGDPSGDNSLGKYKEVFCNAPLFEYLQRVQQPPISPYMQRLVEAGIVPKQNTNKLKLRRWPIADYILQHMKGFFQLTVFDEYHKFKAMTTDLAYAYHYLVMAAPRVLNLTGTLISGYARDLFFLRHRVDTAVRHEYGFNEEAAWTNMYGKGKYIVDAEVEYSENGAFTGNVRIKRTFRPSPGISPQIFPKLLNSCIFARVRDLGYTLPPHTEHIVRLGMNPIQRAQYKFMNETLLEEIKQARRSNNDFVKQRAIKLMPVWMQTALGRPNSGFRAELITWKHPTLDLLRNPKHTALWDTPLDPNDVPERVAYTHYDDVDLRFEEYSCIICSCAPKRCKCWDKETPQQWLLTKETAAQFAQASATAPHSSRSGPSGHPTEHLHTADNKVTTAAAELRALQTEDKYPMMLYPIVHGDQLLPKEEWLITKLQEKVSENRKCLVFVRQSGTRDIQPRLLDILTKAGIRTLVLPAKVKPANRKAWIDENLDNMDAMICNPMAIAEGVTLIEFSVNIYYEISYSLFTMWQSMYRINRLGQSRDTETYYPVYAGTMEEKALTLLSTKMQTALMIYGDSAAGALASESDEGGDLLAELAHQVLKNTDLASDGVTGLLNVEVAPAENAWPDIEIELHKDQSKPEEPTIDFQVRNQWQTNRHNPYTNPAKTNARTQVSNAQLSFADILAD